MNLPNKLSLLRVALIPVMVALMLPQTLVCDLLAAAVFAVAALTDYFDGHIARSRHLITDFGKFIDPVADKLLNLSAMMMLVQRGTLPGWVVVLILARELAVDGLRMVAVGQGRVIDAPLRADYAPARPDRPRVGRCERDRPRRAVDAVDQHRADAVGRRHHPLERHRLLRPQQGLHQGYVMLSEAINSQNHN